MRYVLVDVSLVDTKQLAHRNVAIVDPDGISLSYDVFDHLDERALPQIVRGWFECHPEKTDAFLAGIDDPLNAQLHLPFIAGKNRIENRAVQIAPSGLVAECAQVLGKTRAAKRKTRLQVGRRQIELRVPTENLHDIVRIDAQLATDIGDLIG